MLEPYALDEVIAEDHPTEGPLCPRPPLVGRNRLFHGEHVGLDLFAGATVDEDRPVGVAAVRQLASPPGAEEHDAGIRIDHHRGGAALHIRQPALGPSPRLDQVRKSPVTALGKCLQGVQAGTSALARLCLEDPGNVAAAGKERPEELFVLDRERDVAKLLGD